MLRFDLSREGGTPPKYEIDFSTTADRDSESAFVWYSQRSVSFAFKWYVGLQAQTSRLVEQPESNPIANGIRYGGAVVRRMPYKQGAQTYYVFYSVIEPVQSNRGVVRILRVRNAVMRPIRQAEIDESDEP